MCRDALQGAHAESIITTVAGGGVGDGGAATSALLTKSDNLASYSNASSGGVLVFITDTFHHRIRRVDEFGIITSVAGIGAAGFSGDGGDAKVAKLNRPTGVTAVARRSNSGVVLYIADSINHRIRRVDEDGIIITVAGTGTQGFSGDGGAATAARMSVPFGITAVLNSSSGDIVLYVSEAGNHCIRRVDQSGIITTVVGIGIAGYHGDGGAATAAKLFFPSGIVAMKYPNSSVVLYIADTNNHRIRFVNENGIIFSVAGSGTSGYAGDGGAATAAKLFSPFGIAARLNVSNGGVQLHIADTGNHRIRCVNEEGHINTVAGTGARGFGGDGKDAKEATLNRPSGVVSHLNIDSGNLTLFITDYENARIRRVNERGVMGTAAGGGVGDGGAATAAILNNTAFVTVVPNASGRGVELYISDFDNNRIRRVDATRFITTIAGSGAADFSGDGGPATLAKLRDPVGVTWHDSARTLYIADTGNQRVRAVDAHGVMHTVAGMGEAGYAGDGGAAVNAQLHEPSYVLWHATWGGLLIADTANHCIRLLHENGTIQSLAGNGSMGAAESRVPLASARFNRPLGLALHSRTGDLFISDSGNLRVRRASVAGVVFVVTGSTTPLHGICFEAPFLHGAAPDVDKVWWLWTEEDATMLFANVESFGEMTRAQYTDPRKTSLFRPLGVRVHPSKNGQLQVADSGRHNLITAYFIENVALQAMGNSAAGDGGDGGAPRSASFNLPRVSVFSPNGSLEWVSDTGNSRLRVAESATVVSTPALHGDVTITRPAGMDMHANGTLWLANAGQNTVITVSPSLFATVVAGVANTTGGFNGDGANASACLLNNPLDVALASASAWTDISAFIADSRNHRVRALFHNGTLLTVVGNGSAGYSGDDGPASQAQLQYPAGIAVDPLVGTLYISDTCNNRVRAVAVDGVIRTIAGTGIYAFSRDGVPAVLSALAAPHGLAVDTINGMLFIADRDNSRIRAVYLPGRDVRVGVANATDAECTRAGDCATLSQALRLRAQYATRFHLLTNMSMSASVKIPYTCVDCEIHGAPEVWIKLGATLDLADTVGESDPAYFHAFTTFSLRNLNIDATDMPTNDGGQLSVIVVGVGSDGRDEANPIMFENMTVVGLPASHRLMKVFGSGFSTSLQYSVRCVIRNLVVRLAVSDSRIYPSILVGIVHLAYAASIRVHNVSFELESPTASLSPFASLVAPYAVLSLSYSDTVVVDMIRVRNIQVQPVSSSAYPIALLETQDCAHVNVSNVWVEQASAMHIFSAYSSANVQVSDLHIVNSSLHGTVVFVETIVLSTRADLLLKCRVDVSGVVLSSVRLLPEPLSLRPYDVPHSRGIVAYIRTSSPSTMSNDPFRQAAT
ncbi:MAG: hypothetical protein EOO65_00420, partial [Methanosarcinales archaeon]